MMHTTACELDDIKAHGVVPAEMLDKIRALEDELLKLPQAELPLFHEFPNGLYARTMFIRKDVVLTGAVHKHECYNVISQGDITVATPEGVKRIQAPFMMVSGPGTKRAGWAHEDTVWTTIHPNPDNLRDIAELERILVYSDREIGYDHPELLGDGA
jgi:hypothetical protein